MNNKRKMKKKRITMYIKNGLFSSIFSLLIVMLMGPCLRKKAMLIAILKVLKLTVRLLKTAMLVG
jgi:hypothetical protein